MQSQGHLKGPYSVHVCSDDGDPSVAALGVPEREAPHEIHLERHKEIITAFQLQMWVIHYICIQVIRREDIHPVLYTNLAPRLECTPLWTEENILEVQLDVVLNARHFAKWFNE